MLKLSNNFSFPKIAEPFCRMFGYKISRLESMEKEPEKNRKAIEYLSREIEVLENFYDRVEQGFKDKEREIEMLKIQKAILEMSVKQLNEDHLLAMKEVLAKDKELFELILNKDLGNFFKTIGKEKWESELK